MPYSAKHKAKTREKIVETARILFNRHGFEGVSIDQIMAEVGLTRGGFYNHFETKETLYAEAVAHFLDGRGKTWREDARVDPENGGPETVKAMIDSYLSCAHASDIDGQCPMIALPSDTARASPDVRKSYETLVRAMSWLFENNLPESINNKDDRALVLSALCVGGMVLSRTIDDQEFADRIRSTVREFTIASVEKA